MPSCHLFAPIFPSPLGLPVVVVIPMLGATDVDIAIDMVAEAVGVELVGFEVQDKLSGTYHGALLPCCLTEKVMNIPDPMCRLF